MVLQMFSVDNVKEFRMHLLNSSCQDGKNSLGTVEQRSENFNWRIVPAQHFFLRKESGLFSVIAISCVKQIYWEQASINCFL